MSFYYPRAAVQLRVLLEDFKLLSDASTQQVYTLNVMAKNVTIARNDYKSSDTFNMELDFKSFPFDPRTIRSCGVVIFVQDMHALQDKSGKDLVLQPGLQDSVTAGFVNAQGTNAIFAGFADKDTIVLDDTNQIVKFEGRDYTALLIDQKYQTNSPIALNQKLDVVLKTLLATFKATAEIKIVDLTNTSIPYESQLPTLAEYYPDFGSPLGGLRNTGSHESYWEIIQDLVHRAGLICFIQIDKLVLTTPKNQLPALSDDVKFIYGKNVKSLTFERKLGRFKGFNIQVRSRVGKNIITAKIPEEAEVAWGKGFGFQYQPAQDGKGNALNFAPVQVPVLKPDGSLDTTQTTLAPYISFPVPNVGNKQQLIKIGQTVYEQYSLQQLEGKLETYEMVGRGQTYDSSGKPNAVYPQYDLTQLQKGQTLCIEIDTDDLAAISRLGSVQDRVTYLIRKNYDQTVAAVFAKTMGKFSPRFFTKSYTISIDEMGYKMVINFVNIVDTTMRGLSS